MQALILLILLFALLVSIFAVQNSAPVDISVLFWSFHDVSLVVIILGAFSMGVLLTILLNLIRNFKQMLQVNDLKNRIRQVENEKQHLQEELSRLQTAQRPTEKEQPGK